MVLLLGFTGATQVGNLGCQVEYVDDISRQQNKKESSKPEKVNKV